MFLFKKMLSGFVSAAGFNDKQHLLAKVLLTIYINYELQD